jgi:transcription antitermination factor NusB
MFQVDQVDADPRQAFKYLLEENPLPEKDLEFARELIEGMVTNMQDIDAIIGGFSKDWSVQRMSSVDRNLLRLASYEIMYLNTAQSVVAIDEALEIAKRYSEPASVGFINAILDRIRERQSQEE